MLIDLQDLHFSYSQCAEKPILNIKHWQVQKQQHTFLHGPSGSGKSTLLNILSGVLSGYQGEVNVLGQSLSALSQRQRDHFRATNIGYVFQQFNLIPFLSAQENIQLATQFSQQTQRQASLKHIRQLLSDLNIHSNDSQKPVSRLSIGQQQRVAIARALINQPELLIADEPSSSLDTDNRDQFMSMLMERVAITDTTLLFVSHDQSLAKYFSQVQSLPEINKTSEAHICS